MSKLLQTFVAALAVTVLVSNAAPTTPTSVFETQCNGKSYKYNELAGYGFVPSDFRDKFGDTISIGSSAAFDKKTWKKRGGSYTGIAYLLPDRGWNTEGTINFIPRVHKFSLKFTPVVNATAADPSPPNLEFTYLDTILFSGPDGNPTTGLDADATGSISYPGFPPLPVATYVGDGFGGDGPGGKAISLDCEGITLDGEGGFWISDEYGPYVYNFDSDGKMLDAIRPVDAILPLRNGTVSFSANSPPRYDENKTVIPGNPTQGRQNNQGFEGLTTDPKGDTLYVLLQSAAQQEGGAKASTRRFTRFLQYDISKSGKGKGKSRDPVYVAEYVIPLPTFTNADNETRVAAQSEIHYISDTQFLILARDSSVGYATSDSLSRYRHADIFDISKATNVKGASHDAFNASIASSTGVLNSDITPATYCSFVDYNINSELNKFGLHNGGDQDTGLLNEKWESFALLEADEKGPGKSYYLFSFSDNDFITQNGYFDFGKVIYSDASGYNVNNQALVFKITLPKGAKPLVG